MNITEQTKQSLLAVSVSVVLGTAMLGASLNASAGSFSEVTQASHVTDSVTDIGGGNYEYGYTVFNDGTSAEGFDNDEVIFSSPVIIDWELPYFSDMGLTNILSPLGWTYAIEDVGVANAATGWDGEVSWFDIDDPWYSTFGPDSPFGENNLTQVLHWYCVNPSIFTGDGVFGECGGDSNFGIGTPIFTDDSGSQPTSLGGFSFESTFSAAAAPYQASWAMLPVQSGDPAFPTGGIPGSPSITGVSVPEPGILALMSLGLLGLFRVARRGNKSV